MSKTKPTRLSKTFRGPCEIEGYHGKCHKGHKRCIVDRRRTRARTAQILRTQKVATPKALGSRKRVATTDTAG